MAVRVTPRADRDAIEGVDEAGALRVRVTAAPADGAANTAVTRLVAKAVGLPRTAVRVDSGAGSRHKQLRLEGASVADLDTRWPGVSVRSR
jgi:hypothetical protein